MGKNELDQILDALRSMQRKKNYQKLIIDKATKETRKQVNKYMGKFLRDLTEGIDDDAVPEEKAIINKHIRKSIQKPYTPSQ